MVELNFGCEFCSVWQPKIIGVTSVSGNTIFENERNLYSIHFYYNVLSLHMKCISQLWGLYFHILRYGLEENYLKKFSFINSLSFLCVFFNASFSFRMLLIFFSRLSERSKMSLLEIANIKPIKLNTVWK